MSFESIELTKLKETRYKCNLYKTSILWQVGKQSQNKTYLLMGGNSSNKSLRITGRARNHAQSAAIINQGLYNWIEQIYARVWRMLGSKLTNKLVFYFIEYAFHKIELRTICLDHGLSIYDDFITKTAVNTCCE